MVVLDSRNTKKILSAVIVILGYTCLSGQSVSMYELGKAWSCNTVNTVIFRYHAIVTQQNYQFTSYYADTATMVIVRRNLINNNIKSHIISGRYNIYDSHNAISMGIDSLGYIHISYNHHVNKLNYRKSIEPYRINAWTEEIAMTGVNENSITYPAFIINPIYKTLQFLYRKGGSTSGQACLKQYIVKAGKWIDLHQPLIDGISSVVSRSCNPYWNNVAIDNKGDMHISYVWRTGSLVKENIPFISNIGIDYTHSPNNGVDFFTINNVKQHLPINIINTERVWAVPLASNLINQTSMAVDRAGNPHITYYSDDSNSIPQYMHLWHDGKRWNNSVISNRTEKFVLSGQGTLRLPISRPEIIIDTANTVYVIFRADYTDNKMSALALYPPHYRFEPRNVKTIWSENLGNAEPVIDRLYWSQTNRLTMLVQYNNEPGGDRRQKVEQSTIYLIDCDLISLFDR